ncbi:hypothetical protein INT45_005481 [Circinella minor]|uniref:Uncharacterized protein n=1 Tax=Circinella minor TaxID=1195481 RepID=A0A8H7VEQ6_9FUNG|nr:hypothetical protein INT45_005481 [Circinella minor]
MEPNSSSPDTLSATTTPPSSLTKEHSGSNITFRSYAQVTKGLNITLLYQTSLATRGSDFGSHAYSGSNTPLFPSTLYRQSSEQYSVFYDVTGIGLSYQTHHENERTILEIILESEESSTKACATPLIVDSNHTFQAVQSLPPDLRVIHVSLSQIPILAKNKLESSLRESLSKFGKVLQLGFDEEAGSNWFNSRGFAILSQSSSEIHAPLTHCICYVSPEKGELLVGDLAKSSESKVSFPQGLLQSNYAPEDTQQDEALLGLLPSINDSSSGPDSTTQSKTADSTDRTVSLSNQPKQQYDHTHKSPTEKNKLDNLDEEVDQVSSDEEYAPPTDNEQNSNSFLDHSESMDISEDEVSATQKDSELLVTQLLVPGRQEYENIVATQFGASSCH